MDDKEIDVSLREALKKYQKIRHKRLAIPILPSYDSFNDASTSIRLSIKTKRKLDKHRVGKESYEEVILRLIESNETILQELNEFRELKKSNPSLIKYVETSFIREHKTYTYHPDLKIEYSYNESKLKIINDFSYNLEIDNYLLLGKVIDEEIAIKKTQEINIIKSLYEKTIDYDLDDVFRKSKMQLKSKEEYIRTKYLVYFKIIYFLMNQQTFHRTDERNFFDLDFWKYFYSTKNLSKTSFEEDIRQKLVQYELELKQLNVDTERKRWSVGL
jgi:hypothetical protein